MDIKSKIGREDIANAKIDRERQLNPPSVKQGMEDDEDDFGFDDDEDFAPSLGSPPSPFGSPPLGGAPPLGSGMPPLGSGMPPLGGGMSPPPFGSAPFGGGMSPLGGMPPPPFGSQMGMQNPMGQQQQQQKKEFFSDEKVEEMMAKSAEGAVSYFKDLFSSFKHFNSLQASDMFRYYAISGGIIGVVFIVLSILNIVPFSSMYIAIFTVAGGVVGFGISYASLQKNPNVQHPKEFRGGATPQPQANDGGMPNPFESNGLSGMPPSSPSSMGDDFDFDMDDEEEEDDFDLEVDFDEEFDDFDEDSEFDDFVGEPNLDDFIGDEDEDMSIINNPTATDATNNEINRIIEAINSSTVMSRENLYNAYMQVLPHETPDFHVVTEISSSSEEFDIWDACIKKAAGIFRPPNGEDKHMPHLLEARKNMFYTYLIVQRTPWIKKVEPFIDELVRLIALDEKTGRVADNITGIGQLSGDRMYIKIIENKPTIISLADVMKINKDFYCNPKVKMPVAIGVSEEGEVMLEDFGGINTFLTTGMPRSGKTASVKSIITQLAMFTPPSELEMVILDPKQGASDFKNYDIPHVKKFKTADEDVVRTLEEIIQVEGTKRGKLFAMSGVTKIQDYNELHPDKKMTFLYVIIDEVITLAERMDSDTKKKFQKLLNIIVSQMPAYGIRVFMIPHVIKDNIISKTTTDLIPCRISVMGSPKHIESVTGATPSEFQYKLANIGDMAIRLFQRDVKYARGVLYARDLGERRVLDFIRDMWVKIEPDSFKGSYAEIYAREQELIKMHNASGLAPLEPSTGVSKIQTPSPVQPVKINEPIKTNNQNVLKKDDMLEILAEKDDSMEEFI